MAAAHLHAESPEVGDLPHRLAAAHRSQGSKEGPNSVIFLRQTISLSALRVQIPQVYRVLHLEGSPVQNCRARWAYTHCSAPEVGGHRGLDLPGAPGAGAPGRGAQVWQELLIERLRCATFGREDVFNRKKDASIL